MSRTRFDKRGRRPLANATILLVSLIVSLLAVEGFLRLSPPSDPCCQYDPLFGWSKKSHSNIRSTTREFSITEKFNSRGLRGPEYSYTKDDNEYRILILGDSFAEGFTVEFRELFSEVLKRELNNIGNKYYEVINAGTRGYGTVQELLFFQKEGKKYRPDLTLLMFYDNDIWDNTQPTGREGILRPFYKLVDNRPTLMNFPTPPPYSLNKRALNANRQRKNTTALTKVKGWLTAHSHLYRLARNKIVNVEYLHELSIKFGLATSPLHNPAFGIWRKTYSSEARDAWKVTEAALVNLKKEAHSIQSKFLVFYIPFKLVVYDDLWDAKKKKFGFSDEEWNPGRVGTDLDALCRRQNLVCMNPVKLLRAKEQELRKTEKRLYFRKDVHWTADGHEYIGEILAAFINSNFLSLR